MEETDHTDEGIPCRLVKEEQMAAPLNKKKILDVYKRQGLPHAKNIVAHIYKPVSYTHLIFNDQYLFLV